MTENTNARTDLVESITREVLAALGAGGAGAKPGDLCLTCTGACASRCATKVRDVVAGGASRVAYHGQAHDVPGDLARYIDHTLLRPDASAAEIDKLCAEAKEHGFAAVCINPTWVRRAAEHLRGTGGPKMGVKAAGGIRTAEDVQDMIAAGATRIGASAGVKIVTGEKVAHGQY